jgi:hypothetical protein
MATFWTSTAVSELIRDVEIIYTDALESGDRGRAMKRLRVPPLEEKQSPLVTFRVGIFIGKLLQSILKGMCLIQSCFMNLNFRHDLCFNTDVVYLYYCFE